MLSSRLREVGRFFSSDHEGILKSSLIQRVLSRHFGAVLLACSLGGVVSQNAKAEDRSLSFHHIHTKEDITIVYKRNGQFDQEALQKLNHFMRDWRRNATVKIDPALFDLIWEIYRELGSQKPISVICGHRSGKTNEMLRHTRGGQAKQSKHITGQAIDLQFPDVSAKQIRNSALIRERGGVGYYPTSAIPFVHVDTGNVRAWPRVPRQELAILFPSGQTKHIPADGKRLTKNDFRIALAQLQEKGGELPIAVRARLKPGTVPSTVPASLGGASTPAPAQAPAVLAVTEPAKPKPSVLMASFAPAPLPKLDFAAPKPPSLIEPVVEARSEQTSVRADVEAFARNIILKQGEQPQIEDEAVDSQAEYDDDHPDEEAYQPFPVLPFMSDTPVAEMDLSDSDADFSLAKIHVMFGERKEMLDTRFRPGLQFAELFWAQRFRGGAVNTALRRVDREEAVAAAPAPAPAPGPRGGPVRTAQKAGVSAKN
jgi:uncharacterized protein YcbK (DUF882 family)